jgi:hypothetical protein
VASFVAELISLFLSMAVAIQPRPAIAMPAMCRKATVRPRSIRLPPAVSPDLAAVLIVLARNAVSLRLLAGLRPEVRADHVSGRS